MIGAPWVDPSDLRDIGPSEEEGIAPLNVKDLACPTWGLGKSLSSGTALLTIGPPWLPLIVPPKEVLSLDPTWASACTEIFSGANGLTTFAIFDPPIALTPSAWLVDPTSAPVAAPASPTTISEQTTLSPEAAKPAPPPLNPAAPASKTRGSSSDPVIPNPPAAPVVKTTQESQTQPLGLGGIIYNAFGKSGSDNSPPANDGDLVDGSPDNQNTLTIAGQEFVPNPSGMVIGGSSLLPGGSAVTISNTPISLGSSGFLVVGSSTILLPTPAQVGPPFAPFATKAFTVAGQTFTPNPSAFSVAGTPVIAGGSAITISNTPVSLGSSGILVIGSSSILLSTDPDLPPTPFATKVFTVAGQTFTPNPFAFPIAGTTLSAGGSAVILSGTVVSLGSSGALAIGSSTVALLPTYTVAGRTFTLLPSAIAIAGTTISAGGLAATIDGTIISVQPSGTLIVGSSTIPLWTPQSTFSSDVSIDGFDVEVKSGFAVVDGVIVSPGAAGATISGEVVSLEAGGKTLDVGTGRFALPPMRTGGANGSIDVQTFTGGHSGGLRSSPILLLGFYGTLVLLLI